MIEDLIFNELIKRLNVLEQKYKDNPEGSSDLDEDYTFLRREIMEEVEKYNCTESQKDKLKKRINKIRFDNNLFDEEANRKMMFPNGEDE